MEKKFVSEMNFLDYSHDYFNFVIFVSHICESCLEDAEKNGKKTVRGILDKKVSILIRLAGITLRDTVRLIHLLPIKSIVFTLDP